MICDCGNLTNCLKWNRGKKGKSYWSCNKCDNFSRVYVGDAYFKEPYFEEHLATQKEPQGRWITSKNDKARKMKELGALEAGDRKHGAR